VLGAQGPTHASPRRSTIIGGAVVAGAMPGVGAFRGLRNRHESSRRNRALVKMVRPQVAVVTTVEPVHSGVLPASRRLPTPRRNLCRRRTRRRRGAQPRQCAVRPLQAHAKNSASAHRLVRRRQGIRRAAARRVVARRRSAVHANILGHDVTYKLGMPAVTWR